MKLDGMKKIILLGLILLIVAGIVVVALKGFNVSLFYRQHEELNIIIGKEVNINDIKSICREVFGNKSFIVRTVELFDDSISIRSESITNEEKLEIVNKINEKYEVELKADDLIINENPNIRIRDLVRPYIKPVIASGIVIICYLYLRYLKNSPLKFLVNSFIIILITELGIASLVAITRIPVPPVVVNLMVVISIIELIILISHKEKTLN